MSDNPPRHDPVRALLLNAAAIVENSWCRGRSAENEAGQPLVSTSPPPPANPSPAEISLSPCRFDVGAAMFRAVARLRVPKGKRKEDTRLLYLSVTPEERSVLTEAQRRFCRTAKTMHPSEWNDRVCRSGAEAAAMLRLAAA